MSGWRHRCLRSLHSGRRKVKTGTDLRLIAGVVLSVFVCHVRVFWHFTLSLASLPYALCVACFCQCPRYQNSSVIRRKQQPRLAQTPRTATKRVLFLRDCWHSRTGIQDGQPFGTGSATCGAWLDDTSLERGYMHARWHWSSLQIYIQFKMHGVTDCINCTWHYSSAMTAYDLEMISCTVIPKKSYVARAVTFDSIVTHVCYLKGTVHPKI